MPETLRRAECDLKQGAAKLYDGRQRVDADTEHTSISSLMLKTFPREVLMHDVQ